MSISYDDQRVWKNIHRELKDELVLRVVGLLECLICSEIMHVPFLAVCGHSFCYGCLDAWFETKVNCPTCRQDMAEPPTLNMQLREVSKSITDLVIETREDNVHKEELGAARKKLVDEYERATKAKRVFLYAFDSAPTLIDRSDGVPRCGNCYWEAHGSVCLQCGSRFRAPRGDLYFDSDDGEAYNEDQEEIELYGVDHADYDSEDSFVDNRDAQAIDNDRNNYDSDGLLSSGEEPEAEPWEGFRRNTEMFRESDEGGGYFEDTLGLEATGAVMLGLEHAYTRDENDDRHYNSLHTDDELNLDLDVHYEDAHYHEHSENESCHADIKHAMEELHDRDVDDFSAHYEPDFEQGSDSDWGTSVAMGRRPVHIVDLDSDC